MAACNRRAVIDRFSEMIATGLAIQKRIAVENKLKENDARVTAACASFSDDELKKIWDDWDDDSVEYDKHGLTIDDVHRELNIRGHGEYCAV